MSQPVEDQILCEKQFGLLGTPLHRCDRTFGHSGPHRTTGLPYTGGRDQEDEARTLARARALWTAAGRQDGAT